MSLIIQHKFKTVLVNEEITKVQFVSYHGVASFLLSREIPRECEESKVAGQALPTSVFLLVKVAPSRPPSGLPRLTWQLPLQHCCRRLSWVTDTVHDGKSTFNKGVFHSRLKRVEEVCPFLGVTLNQSCWKGNRESLEKIAMYALNYKENPMIGGRK